MLSTLNIIGHEDRESRREEWKPLPLYIESLPPPHREEVQDPKSKSPTLVIIDEGDEDEDE